MSNRRNFIKLSGLVAGSFIINESLSASEMNPAFKAKSGKLSSMKLTFRPYDLQLKHVFTIANSSRTTTPVMLTEIEYDGLIGYGEASMPPYLGESQKTAAEFLSKVDLSQFSDPFELEDIIAYIDGLAVGNHAAKAAVDIALHDLVGKIGSAVYPLSGYGHQVSHWCSRLLKKSKVDVGFLPPPHETLDKSTFGGFGLCSATR